MYILVHTSILYYFAKLTNIAIGMCMNMNVVIIMKLFRLSNFLPFKNVRFLSFESMEGISLLYYYKSIKLVEGRRSNMNIRELAYRNVTRNRRTYSAYFLSSAFAIMAFLYIRFLRFIRH